MKKIAIIGFGVVGSGVYEIIRKNKDLLTKKAGEEIDVKKVLDIRDFSNHELGDLFTKDFNDILNDDYASSLNIGCKSHRLLYLTSGFGSII